jgi:hypothetical protein
MRRLLGSVVVTALLVMPSLAAAQGAANAPMDPPSIYVAPSLGATFSGDTTSTGTTFGVAGGWRTKGWLGVEGEVATTPNFFEQTGFLTNRWVTTVMGNGLIHYGSTRMSVFAIGGFGLMHVDLAEAGGLLAVNATKPAFNVGAGGMRLWTNNVGIRGDVRYVRATGNKDDDANGFGLEVSKLHYWRATAALVVGF